MDSGIPTSVYLPLTIFAWLVALGRAILLRSTRPDRRVTFALIFAALCCLLRERTFQSFIIDSLGPNVSLPLLYHLSELGVIPSAAALFLLGYAWINDIEPSYLVPLVYLAAIACTVSTFALWWGARGQNIPFTVHSGWAVIAYSASSPAAVAAIVCHDSLVYFYAVMLLITCVRELRRRPDRRAVTISAAIGAVAMGVFVQTATISVATITASTGRHNAFINTVGVLDRFSIAVWTCIGSAVAAIPLSARILEITNLDRYSRYRRRLMPLWSDLTEACPEVIYLQRGRKPVVRMPSRYLLHRTVVEIRDCILILSRYAGREDRTFVLKTAGDCAAFGQAVRLALAWSAKRRGQPPSEDFDAQHSAAMELLDETDELTQLAESWGTAKALIAELVQSGYNEDSSVLPRQRQPLSNATQS